MKIDFVVPWVDGNDPEWRKQKNEYLPKKVSDAGADRYRDMGTLKYWFRAVEKYAPWVNKVHFITWGHLPEWMNTECEKLNIVKHSDYIPEKYLPTFSSHPIGLNVHRIEGLSEQFVYFNDDTLFNGPVEEEFFFKDGLPCDYVYATNVFYHSVDDMYAHVCTNCITETNKFFSYRKSFFSHLSKFVNLKYNLKNNLKNIIKLENGPVFTGIENHHLPCAYLKQSFVDAWDADFTLLDKVSANKFRTAFDVNQSVFRYRQFATGMFSPVSEKFRGKLLRIENNNTHIFETLADERYKMVCINDTPEKIDFDRVSAEIVSAYEKKLPEKSMFEK